MCEIARADKEARRELWIMCSRDPLFYINTFVWTYDPRKEPSALPFITYEYQDEAILETVEAVGRNDLLTEKSRDMGASWIFITVPEWYWHFYDLKSFLFVSRIQDLVDKTEDPDSLFWKIDFILKNQPGWLQPNLNRTKLHIYNEDNGSTIDGASTTGDVGRGGRRTAVLLDEFASVEDGHAVLSATRDTTRCRLFNSTPKGCGNAFYDIRQTDIKKLTLHWSQHPEKRVGLYTSKDGKLQVLDTTCRFPEDYTFVCDGKMRSIWYDGECKRAAHPMEISQELDIDYLGSDFQFFDTQILDKLANSTVRPPFSAGELHFDADTLRPIEFVNNGGRIKLWIHPTIHGDIVEDQEFVVGCDISNGTNSSNSAICVANRRTGEQVAEFVCPIIKPHELAHYAMAVGWWFNEAYLIWEANGPGRLFGDEVITRGYRNIYWRRDEKRLSKKVSDIPGWFSTKENKLALMGDYRKSLSDGTFITRSLEDLRECREYIFTAAGTVEHAKAGRSIDPSGAKDNHGDRPTAAALCSKAIKMNPVITRTEEILPDNCFAARRQAAADRRREQEDD